MSEIMDKGDRAGLFSHESGRLNAKENQIVILLSV